MKIFEPKPPPTSGAITRSLCSGAMPTKAEITSRATCGFWRRVPEREALAAGVVFGDRRARLHRVRHQAIVDEVERGDVRGRLEGRIGRRLIAEVPVVDGVAWGDLVDLRRALALRLGRDRPPPAVPRNRPSTVSAASLAWRQVSAITTATGIADIAGLAGGERRMRRHLHRRAVLGMDHPAADQVADLVGRKIRAGQHRDHARHRAAALRCRSLRSSHARAASGRNTRRPGPGRRDIVGVMALAGDETLIFLAAHRGADSGRSSWRSPPIREVVADDPPTWLPSMSRLAIALAPAAIDLTMFW